MGSFFKIVVLTFILLNESKTLCNARIPDAFQKIISFYHNSHQQYQYNELSILANILWSSENFESPHIALAGEFAQIFNRCKEEETSCHSMLKLMRPSKIHLYVTDDVNLPWYILDQKNRQGFKYIVDFIEKKDLKIYVTSSQSDPEVFPTVKLDSFSNEPANYFEHKKELIENPYYIDKFNVDQPSLQGSRKKCRNKYLPSLNKFFSNSIRLFRDCFGHNTSQDFDIELTTQDSYISDITDPHGLTNIDQY